MGVRVPQVHIHLCGGRQAGSLLHTQGCQTKQHLGGCTWPQNDGGMGVWVPQVHVHLKTIRRAGSLS